jgi:twitching motility protein PilT
MGELEEIFRLASARNASDIHIQAGLPPTFRVRTELVPLECPKLSAEAAEHLIFSILSPAQQALFRERLQLDFSYGVPGVGRFRVNVFRQRDSVAAAFRRFPEEVPTPEALGLPPSAVAELASLKRGFVLITGASGQGKSTSVAALIDRINRDRRVHILTLEDPIEYLFEHRAGVVAQRELGHDMLDFADALRAALREDPDVILLGEMRDLQTIEAALTAAETGHLVFATLHTQTAAQSIDRIVDAFPPHQQPQTRVQLANVLHAVVTQQLLPRIDGEGLCLAAEVLIVTAAVRNLIREAKTFQIPTALQTGGSLGMISMEQSLKALCDRGLISGADAIAHAFDPREMAHMLGRPHRGERP